MATNKFFSIGRFNKMLKNDIMINHKQYLFPLAGASIVVLLIFIFLMTNMNGHYDIHEYIPILFLCLFSGGIFVGSSFSDLNGKKGTCSYLLLPSSVFEKYLVQFVIRFVIFIPLALFLFWIAANLSRIISLQICAWNDNNIIIDVFKPLILLKEANPRDITIILFAIFSTGTYLFSTRLFFKRFPVVKSALLAMFLILIALTFMVILSHIFNPTETRGFEVKLNDIVIWGDFSTMKLFSAVIACLSWLFFLPLGYYLLKEKQE